MCKKHDKNTGAGPRAMKHPKKTLKKGVFFTGFMTFLTFFIEIYRVKNGFLEVLNRKKWVKIGSFLTLFWPKTRFLAQNGPFFSRANSGK
jgi:hypothetical protein